MEMIYPFSFTFQCCRAFRIFAAAEENHVHTVENRQIQAHTVSVCEIMEGSEWKCRQFCQISSGGM